MIRRLQKVNKQLIRKITIISVIAIALATYAVLYLQKWEEQRSERNLQIMMEAIRKNDASICDEIKGGIKKQVPTQIPGAGIVSKMIPARTEEEAKADCVSNVRRAQDLRNPD